MNKITIRYTYKNDTTGEVRTNDMAIEDIEAGKGYQSGFAALLPSFEGFSLYSRDVLPND